MIDVSLTYDQKSEIRLAFDEAFVSPERRRSTRIAYQVAAQISEWKRNRESEPFAVQIEDFSPTGELGATEPGMTVARRQRERALVQDDGFQFDFAPLLLTDRAEAWQPLEALRVSECRFEAVPISSVTAFVAIRCRSRRLARRRSNRPLPASSCALGCVRTCWLNSEAVDLD